MAFFESLAICLPFSGQNSGALMMKSSTRLQQTTTLAALPCFFALTIYADISAAQQTSEDEGSEKRVEEIIVTGSRIAVDSNYSSPSPVTTIEPDIIDQRGTVRVSDLLNKLPQVQGDFGATSDFGGLGGITTVDLRGLGPERTLVLVDGKRLPFGSPLAAPPDISWIPPQLIKRIDIVSGGASAVYGADAVSGVVNFIMEHDFEGVAVDVQSSYFHTANDRSGLDATLRNATVISPTATAPQFEGGIRQGVAIPGSKLDGPSIDVNVVTGVSTADDRGNVTAFIGYHEQDNVLQGDRISSACQLGTQNNGTEFSCAGSTTRFPARFTSLGTSSTGNNFDLTLDGETGAVRDFDFNNDLLNFAPPNNLLDDGERLVFGAFARYQILDELELYLDTSVSDVKRETSEAPGGSFVRSLPIPCNNPFLGPELLQAFCTDQGLGPDDVATVFVGRRDIEGGARSAIFEFKTNRVVAGVRGDVFDGWAYDVFGQYAETNFDGTGIPEYNFDRLSLALDVAFDPASGTFACKSAISGVQPDCVPYNIFQLNADGSTMVTPAARDFLDTPGLRNGQTSQLVYGATLSGDLGQYGISSPWADSGVRVVGGIEYRREKLSLKNDLFLQSGASGNFGSSQNVSGTIDVEEIFFEGQMPIAQDKPFVSDLSINGAIRFSDFTKTTGSQETYAFGIVYSPSTSVRFRGQYQRATRSPNPLELFSSQGIGSFSLSLGPNGFFDPCAGPNPLRTMEECARTGVTPGQFGNVADNPANEFNALRGGNDILDVEKSDTFTFGVIVTPESLPGLSVTLDYFDIDVEDFVGTVPPQLSLNRCLDTGDDFFCNLVNRGAGGSLFAGNDFTDPNVGFVLATNVNTGRKRTKGIDVNLSYDLMLEDIGLAGIGGLSITYAATFLDELSTVSIPGGSKFECAGFFAGQCDKPVPEYTHWLPVTWSTPWANMDVIATWRRIGTVEQFGDNVAPVQAEFSSEDYVDIAVQIPVGFLSLTGGVNNVFDNDPPISSATGLTAGDGNTFPEVYDALGRQIFVGASARF